MIGQERRIGYEALDCHSGQVTTCSGQRGDHGQRPFVVVVEGAYLRHSLLFLHEDTALQNLLHILRSQHQSGVEAVADLAKVGFEGFDTNDELLQPGLGGDDEPELAPSMGGELLGDGLELQQLLAIRADELPHLVHDEDQARWPFGITGHR